MSTIEILHHLGGKAIHIKLLELFYQHKDNEICLRHTDVDKIIHGRTSSHITHYTRKMLQLGLIERVNSSINEQDLGYKITYTGIKFFKMFKKIGENLDSL